MKKRKMKKRNVLIVLLVATALLLSACGAADFPAMEAPANAAPPPPVADDIPMAEAVMEDSWFYDYDEAEFAMEAPAAPPPAPADMPDRERAEETDYFRLPLLTPSDAGDRRLIYTVEMVLQTREFLAGHRILVDTVGEAGGYIVTADIRGSDMRSRRPTEQSAYLRFRIPTERLGEFILVVENNFNIWHLLQVMQEETQWYEHIGWNLDDLREEERHLRELLEEAEEAEENEETEGIDQAQAAERLNEIHRHVRELEAAQAAIMDDVIFSTVDVTLYEAFVPEVREEAEPRMGPVELIFLGLGIFAFALIAFALALVAKTRALKKKKSLDPAEEPRK